MIEQETAYFEGGFFENKMVIRLFKKKVPFYFKNMLLSGSATLCGDSACPSREMLVKLRFLISKCIPLRRSCVSIARNDGKVAISDFQVWPSADIAGKVAFVQSGRESSTSGPAEILKERYCTGDPGAEILHKWSYRIPRQTSWQRDLAQEIRIQRSCTSGHTRSWCRDPDTDVHKRSADRDLAQVVLQRRSWHRHLAQEILIHRSCTSAPTGFCWGDLKHLAREILVFGTNGPTGSWCRHPDREILHKRPAYRDLAQVVLQDPDADIVTERSCTRDPHTPILRKCSYRILGDLDTDILHKRSSYTDLAQEVLQDSAEEILNTLRKRSSYRDLAQVAIQDPDAEVLTQIYAQEIRVQSSCTSSHTEEVLTQTSCARDPHTPILRKCFYRILVRRFWHGHFAQEILIQWSCTSSPRGSWYKHPDTDILRKSSSYSDLAQAVLLQDLGAEILKERSWTRDPHTEILRK